jgi:hypothetical protein
MNNLHNPWLEGIESTGTDNLKVSPVTDEVKLEADGKSLTILVRTEPSSNSASQTLTGKSESLANKREHRTRGFSKTTALVIAAIVLVGYVKREDIKDYFQEKTEVVESSDSTTGSSDVGTGVGPESLRSTTQTEDFGNTIVKNGCSPVLIQEADSTFTDDISKELCWSVGEVVDGLQDGVPRSVGTVTLSANNIYGPIATESLSDWFTGGEITNTELSVFMASNVIVPTQDTILHVFNKNGEPFLDPAGENITAKIAGVR